jgi:hypothetical protein
LEMEWAGMGMGAGTSVCGTFGTAPAQKDQKVASESRVDSQWFYFRFDTRQMASDLKQCIVSADFETLRCIILLPNATLAYSNFELSHLRHRSHNQRVKLVYYGNHLLLLSLSLSKAQRMFTSNIMSSKDTQMGPLPPDNQIDLPHHHAQE